LYFIERRAKFPLSLYLLLMRVRVLLFGQLKDIVGRQEESLELEAGSRLASVMAHYAGRYPSFQGLAGSIACSINQEYAPATAALKDGDEVGLLPPVSGGSETAPLTVSASNISAKPGCGPLGRRREQSG
jgi:molybdopterin converting factor subunit 1